MTKATVKKLFKKQFEGAQARTLPPLQEQPTSPLPQQQQQQQ
eukprot:CAMPEP_0172753836 /NCGR_PEP_ID=MMETSP1074-20121228/156782_1 /TAXON_ID=2916 /ORGANISM="Ceratium fusus, Strain PA161109" /LENGTH=41 /DNA_ID= /DNA_START= /DNA_END= /DNA_ORIENTATION=